MKNKRVKRMLVVLLLLFVPICSYPQDRNCAEPKSIRTSGSKEIEQLTVGLPFSGWVGYTNTGTPVPGMRIDVFADELHTKVAATTTDKEGRFSFANLKQGTYHLRGTSPNVIPIHNVIRVSARSKAIACLITEASGDIK